MSHESPLARRLLAYRASAPKRPAMRQTGRRALSLRSKFLVWFTRDAARKTGVAVSTCQLFAACRFVKTGVPVSTWSLSGTWRFWTSRFAQAGRGRPQIRGACFQGAHFGGGVSGHVLRRMGRPVQGGASAQASYVGLYRTSHEGAYALALCSDMCPGVAAFVGPHTWGCLCRMASCNGWSSRMRHRDIEVEREPDGRRARVQREASNPRAGRVSGRWVSEHRVARAQCKPADRLRCRAACGSGPCLQRPSNIGPCLQPAHEYAHTPGGRSHSADRNRAARGVESSRASARVGSLSLRERTRAR